ncbi:class II aldolase/adducin family protein [Pseudodesulfovibrio indicus]|uniref:Ribulose-5-phosphate 4-epimerase/fuculose-1-phosphate aldolase n=1 Tax=Pseudodesulfovibrio indicus TaxID=1716143 RepID=A0A126QMC6_9BACT|nr:class II aldolase/adducin family protein [Pseudodesulfovibrio indicus]AMK11233.1 rRNA adenine dimethylase [Pseudodesulfovibrio indicus]TDT92260.1 ribulose-5-phosphate 4-epimerase/fuculose-1-phosphate aldolase [Pseudodesulfovibrio indicus]
MKDLCEKYAAKLLAQGLASSEDAPLIGGLDAELVWNREDPRTEVLAGLFDRLSINSLVFSRPAEPYQTILDFLAERWPGTIRPEDTETRTFLHDIPVCREFTADAMGAQLEKRKVVVLPGLGVVSCGSVSPEQGFVYLSSALFSCFVLFFSEYLNRARQGTLDHDYRAAFERAVSLLPAPRTAPPALAPAPLDTEEKALTAIFEAGRQVVGHGLVDSFFGNISLRLGDTILISQTGSSLDELEGCVDPCPMDGSATTGLTASSELTAHEDVYRRSDSTCILHGHPRFTVIMSMDCAKADCPNRGECHIRCTECRTVDGVPIVPGEVGTGPTGLCNTLPPAMASEGAAIVHGHGLFTAGTADFNEPFARLLDIENRCRELYFERIAEYA